MDMTEQIQIDECKNEQDEGFLMCHFLSLTAREIAKQRYVGTDISIVATAIV